MSPPPPCYPDNSTKIYNMIQHHRINITNNGNVQPLLYEQIIEYPVIIKMLRIRSPRDINSVSVGPTRSLVACLSYSYNVSNNFP